MNYKNKFGLSRNIPLPTKRIIRQRCGFGCVICGQALYHYHHYDPPFSEAKQHNPDKNVLLCGSCHHYAGKLWSQDKIKEAHKNPKCIEEGFSHGLFDIGKDPPTIFLGNSIFRNTKIIIQILETPILRIDPPELEGNPFRISGIFCDSSGNECFRIERNEWIGPISMWDIECNPPNIIIRIAPKKIVLRLFIEPPNKIHIEKIDMKFRDACIKGPTSEGFIIIRTPSGKISITSRNVTHDVDCAYFIQEDNFIVGVSRLPNFRIGRNVKCPCMSGLKYKDCCGKRLF